MNGRIYVITAQPRRAAIETEVHGYTVIELCDDADVQVGDEIEWDSDLQTGASEYRNLSTNRRSPSSPRRISSIRGTSARC